MEYNRPIKSTSYLKVTNPRKGVYLIWTPNYFGLIPPKLRYELNDRGEIKLINILGQLKAITINSLILCGIVIIVELIISSGQLNLHEIYPFLLGIIGFMVLLNFLIIASTKWKVDKQIKKRHANKN